MNTTPPRFKDAKMIPLTRGMFAVVDAKDFEWLSKYKWNCNKKGYATRGVLKSEKTHLKNMQMHRQILGPPDGLDVDHVNGDGLDNRRSNIRIATRRQNMGNAKLRKDNTSGHKGVHWNKILKKWHVTITIEGKAKYLGIYSRIGDAREAYRDAAIKHFGKEFVNV